MKRNKDIAFNGVFWVLYFLYQWLALAALYGDYHSYFINACLALPVSLAYSLLAVHILLPWHYKKGYKALFWMEIILTSFLLLLLRRYFNYYFIYPHYFPFALKMPFFSAGKFLVDFVNLYAITGLYGLYYAIRYGYQERQRVQALLQQQTLAELELLKVQVQPHFVFNTLNNIYGTALEKSPETAELIAHLSGFLNYNLYEASKDKVGLMQEIDYVKHYIELQKNRYGNRLDASINIFNDVSNIQLPPMLLLPLIENCFKHGVAESTGKSWVRIDISRTSNQLFIKIENSREEKAKHRSLGSGGIGLANVSKRLQLVYPGTHALKIIEGMNAYLVVLKIDLPR